MSCKESTQGSQKKKMTEIPYGKLRGAPVTMQDLNPRFTKPIQACQSNQIVEVTRFKEKYPDLQERKTLPNT